MTTDEYVPDEQDFIDSWACAHVTPHDMTAEEAKDVARAFLAHVRRDAAREVLDGLIADKAHMAALLHAENGGNVEDVLTHYRDTRYSHEEGASDMTQPDIIDWDEFPDRQVSEIQELTEAIRDLAAAIRGSNRQQDIDISLEANVPLGDVEDRIARYNALRDREEKTLGPEFPEAESPEAPLRDWEKDLLHSLDELPDGAYVDLDPPRALPRAVALKVDIDEDPEIMVHRVFKGPVDHGWVTHHAYPWHAWSDGEDPEHDAPWGLETEQVEALGLSYSDFTLPTVPRPEPEDDPVKHPAHYQMGGRECLEFTRDMDFCWGNVVKYLWRAPHKGNLTQDIDKALEYLELADSSKRPFVSPDEEEEDPFNFFYDLCLKAPDGSVKGCQLDALAAVFNPYISIGSLQERIKEVRDRHIATQD